MTLLTPDVETIPFRRPAETLDALGGEMAARVVAAASDVALVLGEDGVIVDLAVNSPELAGDGLTDWLDRPWIDTVTSESRQKVAEIIRDAKAGKVSRWREVNHPSEDGTVLIRYFALDSGEDGRVIVIGRDMRSNTALQQRLLQVQQSVERDYLRLRQAESRYRLLFQMASEAVFIVDAANRRIREANPAASRLTGAAESAIAGQPFVSLLDSASVEDATQLLNSVHAAVSPTPVSVRLANGTECSLAASLFRQEQSTRLLIRLSERQPSADAPASSAQLNQVLDRISDAFVVTDADLRILTVNPAFLDMSQLATAEQARDQSLERFLGRPHIDLKVMLGQLKEHGSLRNFATVLRGRYGGAEEVEVSAVSVLDADPPCLGFSIRGVARRMTPPPSMGASTGRSVEQLTQLIGRVPMKEIVRESTDLIERLCIEAALTLTSNNRASAADLLGLSRQSLYSKLHRYGMAAQDEVGH
jgi:transcriptional regulator PpsR